MYGGYGYFNNWHVKRIEKIKYLVMHYRQHDTTGKLIKISMKWTQLELGFQKSFYQYNYKECSEYVTSTWITDILKCLQTCSASIIESSSWTISLPRENDFFLNQIVYESNIEHDHKIIFNEIRIYLRLITASDIVAIGSKSKILPNIFECTNFRPSSYQWPNSLPFPAKWKSIWTTILKTIIQPCLHSSPLGKWISETHQIWPATASYSNKFVNYYDQYYKVTKVSRRSNYEVTTKTAECKLQACVMPTTNGIRLVNVGSTYSPPPPPVRPKTAWHFYNNAAKWQKKNWGSAPITEKYWL